MKPLETPHCETLVRDKVQLALEHCTDKTSTLRKEQEGVKSAKSVTRVNKLRNMHSETQSTRGLERYVKAFANALNYTAWQITWSTQFQLIETSKIVNLSPKQIMQG